MEERRQGMDDLKADVKKILHILNGNGEVGLVARVAEHETQIQKWIALNSMVLNTFVGAIIIGVVGFVLFRVGIHT